MLEGKASWAYGLMESAVRSSGKTDANLLHSLAWSAYYLGKVERGRGWMQQILENGPENRRSPRRCRFFGLHRRIPRRSRNRPRSQRKIAARRRLCSRPHGRRPAIWPGKGLRSDAAAVYERVLIRWPDFPIAQKKLAAVYAQDSQRLEEARNLALQARKTLPGDAELAKILGCIAFQRGEPDYAIRMLEESAKSSPLDGEGLVYLGISYLKTGQKSKGKATLRGAMDAGLDENLSDQAKTALAGPGTEGT